jgi:Tfp pilus assembly protein PilE
MIMIIVIMTSYDEYVSKSERHSGTQALVSNSDKNCVYISC